MQNSQWQLHMGCKQILQDHCHSQAKRVVETHASVKLSSTLDSTVMGNPLRDQTTLTSLTKAASTKIRA